MKSFQVTGRFKSNRKTYRPVTGGHQITSTKSLISLELTILTRLRLVTILLGLGCKILMFLTIEHFYAAVPIKIPSMI